MLEIMASPTSVSAPPTNLVKLGDTEMKILRLTRSMRHCLVKSRTWVAVVTLNAIIFLLGFSIFDAEMLSLGPQKLILGERAFHRLERRIHRSHAIMKEKRRTATTSSAVVAPQKLPDWNGAPSRPRQLLPPEVDSLAETLAEKIQSLRERGMVDEVQFKESRAARHHTINKVGDSSSRTAGDGVATDDQVAPFRRSSYVPPNGARHAPLRFYGHCAKARSHPTTKASAVINNTGWKVLPNAEAPSKALAKAAADEAFRRCVQDTDMQYDVMEGGR
jgi:hypothetical protein